MRSILWNASGTNSNRARTASSLFPGASTGSRFLQLTGLAGVGLASGVGRAFGDDDPLKPTDAAVALEIGQTLPVETSGCSNTPFGGPFYHGLPDITPPNGPGQRDKALFDLDRVWPIGQAIIVKFLNGHSVPNPGLRQWFLYVQQKVREIAPNWCDYANVSMQFATDGPCHMTVNFLPVSDQNGRQNYGVFNCFLGQDCMKVKSRVQSMNLTFDPVMQQWDPNFRESEFHRLIQHEFGHALALIHEHQRPDRNIVWMQSLYQVAKEKWRWDPEIVNQQILPIQPGFKFAGTAFDPHSIMMYEYPPNVAFYQKEGAPKNTPDFTAPFSSPRNTELTALDKVAAAVIYPKPGAPGSARMRWRWAVTRVRARSPRPARWPRSNSRPTRTATTGSPSAGRCPSWWAC